MPEMAPSLAAYASRVLESHGVRVRVRSRGRRLDFDEQERTFAVHMSGGTPKRDGSDGSELLKIIQSCPSCPAFYSPFVLRAVPHWSPNQSGMFEAQCVLGECLAAQGAGDEALIALTAGVEGLEHQASLPRELEARRQSAGKALLSLLDSRGQKDQADSLRARLATTRPATLPTSQPR